MKIYSFPYISSPESKILILGTMPGTRSLIMNQYYGHGGNAFWKIMFAIFEETFSKDYERRKQLLIENKIALWDVLKGCEREGSADHAIEKEEANDFPQFFKAHGKIKLIAFNGKNASEYFNRHVREQPDIPTITFPSTSSANGWKRFDEKLSEWKQINKRNQLNLGCLFKF